MAPQSSAAAQRGPATPAETSDSLTDVTKTAAVSTMSSVRGRITRSSSGSRARTAYPEPATASATSSPP